jgi:hypothetical protein
VNPRVPDLQEIAEDLKRIEERTERMEDKLDARFVPRELYEARHTALRSEVALEMASLKSRQEADRANNLAWMEAAYKKIEATEAATDRKVSAIDKRTQWMFGIMAVPIIGAVVVALTQGLPT